MRTYSRLIGAPVRLTALDRTNAILTLGVRGPSSILHRAAFTIHNVALAAVWVRIEIASNTTTASLNDAETLFEGWIRTAPVVFPGGGTTGTNYMNPSVVWEGVFPLSTISSGTAGSLDRWSLRAVAIVQNGQSPTPCTLSAVVSEEV